MSQPILTLLTDFGERDPYVGSMKGVIAGIAPQAQVIDLTHLIPAQDIAAARFCLMSVFRDFPPGSIHLAVVDPGVGSSRRGVAIQLESGYLVGPDNGLFSGVLDLSPPLAAVQLTRIDRWRTPHPSATFQGRDIFAPVAAHLANGVTLDQFGEAIALEDLVDLGLSSYQLTKTGIQASIQYVDHFGNLITTIPAAQVQDRAWQIRVGQHVIPAGQTFSSVKVGEPLGLIGSLGWVEIAVNQGSAKHSLDLGVWDLIELELL